MNEHKYDYRYEHEKRFGITEDEHMWKRISYNRLLEIIKQDDVHVVGMGRDTNSYGEWNFIELEKDGPGPRIEFYGHGWHEHKEKFLVNNWSYYRVGSYNQPEEHLDKKYVLQELQKEHKMYTERAKTASGRRSEKAKIFSLLAETSDEDGALTMMEDMGLL